MKINTQKWIRVIPCFLTVALVLFLSVVPAFAATFTGTWTLNNNIAAPDWDTVTVNFESNGVSYTEMSYEYSEAYLVPVIMYGNNTAIYWRNGQTFFMKPEYQYINFSGFQVNMSEAFTYWMYNNAQSGRITSDSEAADNIKDKVDDAAGRLEDANDIWNELPEPTLSGDEFGFLLNERPEYLQFIQVWHTFWNNTILSQMMLILGGLLLTSFMIFAGK